MPVGEKQRDARKGKKVAAFRPKVITTRDYDYYRQQALFPDKREVEQEREEAEKRKEMLIMSSMSRKERIREWDMKRAERKDGKLGDIEAEAKERAMHLLERACNLQLEQEQEIKECNRLILQAKCSAIRDAQVGLYLVALREKCIISVYLIKINTTLHLCKVLLEILVGVTFENIIFKNLQLHNYNTFQELTTNLVEPNQELLVLTCKFIE